MTSAMIFVLCVGIAVVIVTLAVIAYEEFGKSLF